LNARFVKALRCGKATADYVAGLVREWQTIYDRPPSDVSQFLKDISEVIESIFSSRLKTLKDKSGKELSIRSLAGFNSEDFSAQMKLSELLLHRSQLPEEGTLRHVPGAAFLAMERLGGARCVSTDELSDLVIDHIHKLAPPGQLAVRTKASTEHLKFLADVCYDATKEPRQE
jgi:hypothetical protein